jgi:hypothetical protein
MTQINLSRESDSWRQYFCVLYGDHLSKFLADATFEGRWVGVGTLCSEPWLSLQGQSMHEAPSSGSVLLTSLLYRIRTFARFRLKKCSCTFVHFLFLLWRDTESHVTVVAWRTDLPTQDDSWLCTEIDGIVIKRGSWTYSEKNLSWCHAAHRKFRCTGLESNPNLRVGTDPVSLYSTFVTSSLEVESCGMLRDWHAVERKLSKTEYQNKEN